MKYRIYYDNGDTYSGDPFWAPATGVIVIAVEDTTKETGYKMVLAKNAYLYKEGRWWGCDEAGMYDYLMMFPGPKAILFGRTIRDELYWEIVQRATKEGLDV